MLLAESKNMYWPTTAKRDIRHLSESEIFAKVTEKKKDVSEVFELLKKKQRKETFFKKYKYVEIKYLTLIINS